MAFDPRVEIFAYKWFWRLIEEKNETSSLRYDVMKLYEDECSVDLECNVVSDNEYLYQSIMFRHWLFDNLYTEEIKSAIKEFQDSQMDFYCYVLRTCNRADLFGNLSIFERVFATCAFVTCLCLYCQDNGYSEIMKYGYICWAMYFDQYTNEFYKQGGWDRLKMVAISYELPIKFRTNIVRKVEDGDIVFAKIRKAMKSYHRFKRMAVVDHDECVSILWIKFYKQYINGNFDNDFDQFSEDSHFSKLENYSEIEDTLKKFKYLCDPNGSEILKYLARMSSTGFLETSMANLDIRELKEKAVLTPGLEKNNTFVNLTSKSPKNLNFVEKNDLTFWESGKATPRSFAILSKQNNLETIENVSEADRLKAEFSHWKNLEQALKAATVEDSFENLTISECEEGKEVKEDGILTVPVHSTGIITEKSDCAESRSDHTEEPREWKDIKINENRVLTEHLSCAECNDENMNSNKTENDTAKDKESEIKKGNTRCTCLSERITFTTENAVKGGSNQDLKDTQKKLYKRKSGKKIPIPYNENKTTTKNTDAIQNNARNEQDEYKTIQLEKKSTIQSAKLPSSKTGTKKRKGKKNVSYIKKDTDEIKEKNGENNYAVLTGQISSTGRNAEEENKKSRNSVREEQKDDDIKKFLRMLLVLGDKQGINYLRNTL